MTWTYSADPENSDRDAVRLLIGDTDANDQQLQDSEINYFISSTSDVYSAAALASRTLASKYSRYIDRYVGDLRLQYSQRAKAYLALAEQLEFQAAHFIGVSPFLGGDSISDKDTGYDDTNKVQPYFVRDQFDNPETLDNTA